jgi:hypothetical protein
MIKPRAAGAGLDGSFAGHSLRSGFATEGYAQGTPELAIMRQGRWKSGKCDAWLCPGRNRLERQCRCTARAIGLSIRVFLSQNGFADLAIQPVQKFVPYLRFV